MSIDDEIKQIVAKELQRLIQEHGLSCEKVFNAKEAAEYLRVSRNWLYQNIDNIPHTDIGGYKFLKSDLDHHIKEGRQINMKVNVRDYKGSGCNYKVN